MAERDIQGAMKDVYGANVENQWQTHISSREGLPQDEQILAWETRPTAEDTFFLREPNLAYITEALRGTPAAPARILDIGSSYGPEPFELALRMQGLGQAFQIDALDVGQDLLDNVHTGRFSLPIPPNPEIGAFVTNHRSLGNIDVEGQEFVELPDGQGRIPVANYRLAPQVRESITPVLFDIIDGPYGEPNTYNAALCNNMLFNYPETTRTVILSHIIDPLREGALVGLERVRSETDPDRPQVENLDQYYQWRGNLAHFGLTPVASDRTDVLRYNPDNNIFRGRRLGIRGERLVDLPPRRS